MSRSTHLLLTAALLLTIVTFAAYLFAGARPARGDVGGVYSNVPWFVPEQIVTITVSAEDDDGTLEIESDLDGSKLTVVNCTGIGTDQNAGECDGSGKKAVTGQGTDRIRIKTDQLDDDGDAELLTVSLTLIADCNKKTKVTISGDQPGNVGPDDVTINCEPPTPTPMPTSTPVPTATPVTCPAANGMAPTPMATSSGFTCPLPQPPAAPLATITSEVQGSVIVPPSTGSGGLR
jgi:hypothetical protein